MTMILGQLVKASLIATDVGVTPVLPFTYNPAEISTSKSATWSRPQARGATSATQPQFQGLFVDGAGKVYLTPGMKSKYGADVKEQAW